MNLKLTSKLERLRKSKKGIGACVLAAGVTAITMIPQSAYAHGFVEKPSSRAALCSQNYGALNLNCGNVMYEPQSLEAPKGFPDGGPIDGEIASAGGLFGGILDQQTSNRWFKNTIKGEQIHLHGNTQRHILQVNGIITLPKRDGILINH